MPPPVSDEHATSGLPSSGPCVAPTASTYGDVAGNDGSKPHLPGSWRAAKFATPSSPDATSTVRPRTPSLHTSVLKRSMSFFGSSGASEPYDTECTSGASGRFATAVIHARKMSPTSAGTDQNHVCAPAANDVICCTSRFASMQLFGSTSHWPGSLSPITRLMLVSGSWKRRCHALRSDGAKSWPSDAKMSCVALGDATVRFCTW
mmetsp:Transcript_3308/g.7928  ORF Transcript_3308/g.7928 Transcript_3308/m.7928 type:complete len:205 (-) Transcript_3308:69-683(-)